MKVLLTINLPPALEEDLVDYLLTIDSVSGFTSYRVQGHGDHLHLSIAEQVSGRRNRMQFEMLMDDGAIDEVVESLAESVGRDIVYWHTEVIGMGRT